MSNAGYIYVLINPSMDGLVKIGKTTREPTGRAKELSGATGVPTPFVLAYDALFTDCSAAEEFVHALLEQKGYRVSSNREFFNASISEAIKAVIEAERVLGAFHTDHVNSGVGLPQDPQLSDQTALGEPVWQVTLERAEESYYGLGLTIQDHVEAARLYKVAAKLGSSFACIMLGIMSKNGEACRKDSTIALEFFKQGLGIGDERCWAEMALMYLQDGHYDNANKCWHHYFGSKGFREDKPTHVWYSRPMYVFHCYQQLCRSAHLRNPEKAPAGIFPSSFKRELSVIKAELLRETRATLNHCKERDDEQLSNATPVVREYVLKNSIVPFYEKLLEELDAQI